MPRFGASNVLVRRRPRAWPIFVAAFVAVALPAAAGIYLVASLIFLVEVLFLFFLPAILYEDSLKGERRVSAIHADAEGLWFGKVLILPRARIDACATEALAEGQCRVQLWGSRARDDVSVVLPDAERAQLMIDALGLRSDRHAARFLVESAPLRSPGAARLVRAIVMLGAASIIAAVILLTLHSEWFGFTLVPLMFLYFGLVRRLRRRRVITLGADALVVRESIPLSAIGSVKAGHGSDALVDQMVLRFDGRDATDKRDAFVTRLQRSLADRDAVPVAAMLEPGERPTSTWLEDLRRLGGDGYRSGGVATEDLWRIVEQRAAAPGARIGALALLVSRLDAEGRVRLAEIAEATVKPEVRAALEAAAEEGATDERVLEAFQR